MFWPVQQELDCITSSGKILGKIKFDGDNNQYVFTPIEEALVLSEAERTKILERLAGLSSGKYTIPMQDDD